MNHYPETPARGQTDTSADAADALTETGRHSTLRERVAHVIADYEQGITADEAATILNESPLAVRPRVTELHKMGRIKDTRVRRFNVSGMAAIVWRSATPEEQATDPQILRLEADLTATQINLAKQRDLAERRFNRTVLLGMELSKANRALQRANKTKKHLRKANDLLRKIAKLVREPNPQTPEMKILHCDHIRVLTIDYAAGLALANYKEGAQ